MAMGRSEVVQTHLMSRRARMPRSPGHAFYDRLQTSRKPDDASVEGACKPYTRGSARRRFRRDGIPHAHDRLLRIDSSGHRVALRGPFSLRFLRLSNVRGSDHRRCRARRVCHGARDGERVLKLVVERGLMKGERIGVDGSTIEANAACRDRAARQRQELSRDADADGERERSNASARTWRASTRSARARRCRRRLEQPDRRDARIAKMKTKRRIWPTSRARGRPRTASSWPRRSIPPTKAVRRRFRRRWAPPRATSTRWARAERGGPCVVVAEQGLSFARNNEEALEGGGGRTRIDEPEPIQGYLVGIATRRRQSGLPPIACAAEIGYRRGDDARRGEIVERSFGHVLDSGGMRRAWLRGRENLHSAKPEFHVAGFDLERLDARLRQDAEGAEAVSASFSFSDPTRRSLWA